MTTLEEQLTEARKALAQQADLNCSLVSQNCLLIERNKALGDTPTLFGVERRELDAWRSLVFWMNDRQKFDRVVSYPHWDDTFETFTILAEDHDGQRTLGHGETPGAAVLNLAVKLGLTHA